MSITESQQRLLEKPFRPEEHDFVYGQCYIRKSAIRARLNLVDPGWQISPPVLMNADENLVVMRGALIIAGVKRNAIGTGIIQRTKTDKKTGVITEFTGFELARMVAKAYKTAASDLLPRSAIMFGLGEYLKQLPKGTENMDQLKPWLQNQFAAFHWAYNGGGQQVTARMKELGLAWGDIAAKIEPGRRLRSLSDTLLPVEEFLAGLERIKG